jgi:hypothetical protein
MPSLWIRIKIFGYIRCCILEGKGFLRIQLKCLGERRRDMNNKWLVLINPIIAVLVVSQAVTGLNLFFDFLDEKTFVALHAVGGYLLLVLVSIHLGINWFWVKNIFVKKAKKPAPEKK